MDASVVVAICATVIAVVSLAVSVYEARATRRHNRISVRPFLELRVGLSQGRMAGLQLINAGLGPAAIARTVLTLDRIALPRLASSTLRSSKSTTTPAVGRPKSASCDKMVSSKRCRSAETSVLSTAVLDLGMISLTSSKASRPSNPRRTYCASVGCLTPTRRL